MQLIAVVLGAPTSDKRFSSAKALLDHGFANYRINRAVEEGEEAGEAIVINGVSDTVKAVTKEGRSYLENKMETDKKEEQVYIHQSLTAPINEGDVIGHMDIVKGSEVIDTIDLCAAKAVDKKGYFMVAGELISSMLGINFGENS